MKKIIFVLSIVFAMFPTVVNADEANISVPKGLLAQGYGSSSVVGIYYSSDLSMSDMPGGQGYWMLKLTSDNRFVLKRCCSMNGNLVLETYSGEYKYISNNGEGAGSLWSNGSRIGTFITTSTGIRLGTIDMRKR